MSILKANKIVTLDGHVVYEQGMTIANDSVEYLSQLLNVNPNATAVVNVLNYHNGLEGGGGVFYWDAGKDKSEHNGGTIIDPSAVFPSVWDSTTESQTAIGNWFDTSNADTGCWVRQYDGAVNVKWFGAKVDGSSDDTLAFKKSIGSNDYIEGFEGTLRFTSTVDLNLRTTLNSLSNKAATPGYVTRYLFDPENAVSTSTLASDIDSTQTTIALGSTVGFPSQGVLQIGLMTDCEYVTYTGITNNTLTGVNRARFGGTVGNVIVDPNNTFEGVAWNAGTSVKSVQNAFQRVGGSFQGTFGAVHIYHSKFNSTTTPRVYGDGTAIFLDYAAYTEVCNGTSIRGFERGIYTGRSYVTSLNKPMFYYCLVGGQIDIGNGATVTAADSGMIGDAVVNGTTWITKGGEGLTFIGGNHGNGGTNLAFKNIGTTPLLLEGIYIEAAKRANIATTNNGVTYVTNSYIKEGFYIGSVSTGGKAYFENIVVRNISNVSTLPVYNSDGTGSWTASRIYDKDNLSFIPDSYSIAGKGIGNVFQKNSFVLPDTTESMYTLKSSKEVTNNVSSNLFKVRTRAMSSITDVTLSLRLKVTVKGEYRSEGAVTQVQYYDLLVHHRQTLPPSVLIVKVTEHEVKAPTSSSVERVTNISSSVSDLGSGRFETTFSILSDTTNDADCVIDFYVESSELNQIDNKDLGGITLL